MNQDLHDTNVAHDERPAHMSASEKELVTHNERLALRSIAVIQWAQLPARGKVGDFTFENSISMGEAGEWSDHLEISHPALEGDVIGEAYGRECELLLTPQLEALR